MRVALTTTSNRVPGSKTGSYVKSLHWTSHF